MSPHRKAAAWITAVIATAVVIPVAVVDVRNHNRRDNQVIDQVKQTIQEQGWVPVGPYRIVDVYGTDEDYMVGSVQIGDCEDIAVRAALVHTPSSYTVGEVSLRFEIVTGSTTRHTSLGIETATEEFLRAHQSEFQIEDCFA